MNQLLIPTDFADQSVPILDYGFDLAFSMNMGVQLYFCLDISKFNAPYFHFETNDLPFDLNDYTEVFENVGKRCYQYIEIVKKKYGDDFPIDYQAGSGWLASQVIQMTNTRDVGMLLLQGKKKYGFFDRIIHNADRVLMDEAPCLVWIVPPNFQFKPFRKILFLTDSNEWNLPVLKKLSLLSVYYEAFLDVLNVSGDHVFMGQMRDMEAIQMVQSELGFEDISFQAMEGPVSIQHIDRYLVDGNHDLLVLLKKSRHFLNHMLSGKQARKLLFTAELPVLLYQEDEKIIDALAQKKYRRMEG